MINLIVRGSHQLNYMNHVYAKDINLTKNMKRCDRYCDRISYIIHSTLFKRRLTSPVLSKLSTNMNSVNINNPVLFAFVCNKTTKQI